MSDWYSLSDGKVYGPFGEAEMKQSATDGDLTHVDLIWREGLAEWVRAGSVKGLFTGPPPIPTVGREYKVLRIDSKLLTASVDSSEIQELLNRHARDGWVVKSMVEFDPPSFTGDARAFLIILERERS
jgi:hypothetical protein